MSNREKCLTLIDSFSEEQLQRVALLLESVRALAEDSADDAYCRRLYDAYQSSPDKGDPIDARDFAESLGFNLQ